MTMVSARPDNLAAYRSKLEMMDRDLRSTADSLLETLQAYRTRSREFGADHTELAHVLGRHATAMEQLDGWVGRVGEAFRQADRAPGPVPVGVVLTAEESVKVAPPEFSEPPGQPGGSKFILGDPTKPPLQWDEDFPYDPNAKPTLEDYKAWFRWKAKLKGADILRPDLDDALSAYRHYMDGSGDSLTVDYEEAYREDPAIRAIVDSEIVSAQQAADRLARESNLTSFKITGDATPSGKLGPYPKTENWQKTLGAHQVWSNADVQVHDGKITMRIVVHAEDRYNFNKGDADIATGTPDEENGRFAQLGWARSFDTHGEVVRTITWDIGDPSAPSVGETGDPQRNPGREDREDSRGSADGGRPVVPDNNRDSGEPRVG